MPVALGAAVAASLLLGALVAAFTNLPERLSAIVTAFGGGILLAAVALELVPEADARAGQAVTAAGLLAGALAYVGADAWLTREASMRSMRRAGHAAAAGGEMEMEDTESTRGEAIAAGIFIDGVPESIALGLTAAESAAGLALLAGVLIGNVVEAYGAAQPIIASGRSKRFAVTLLGGIGLALMLSTVLGGTLLADVSDTFNGASQAVAAGAVLAVVSISVIPYAFDRVSRVVATATVAGFVVGYLLS